MSAEEQKPSVAQARKVGKRIRKNPTKPVKPIDGEQDDDLLMPSQDEVACVHFCIEGSPEFAASKLGWTVKDALDCLAKPSVRSYYSEYRKQFIKRMVLNQTRRLMAVGVNKVEIEKRFMELARLEPEETKGSIAGQVAALNGLAAVLQLTGKDGLNDMTDEEMEQLIADMNVRLAARKQKAGNATVQ